MCTGMGMLKRFTFERFPFPSNGKAHVHRPHPQAWHTTIWFPFPSNGKAHVHAYGRVGIIHTDCFHSLQTGKHMCTGSRARNLVLANCLFPFPSNGKAHVHKTKWEFSGVAKGQKFPFPSNGKAHVHYTPTADEDEEQDGFHSLQTGKHMCTYPG